MLSPARPRRALSGCIALALVAACGGDTASTGTNPAVGDYALYSVNGSTSAPFILYSDTAAGQLEAAQLTSGSLHLGGDERYQSLFNRQVTTGVTTFIFPTDTSRGTWSLSGSQVALLPDSTSPEQPPARLLTFSGNELSFTVTSGPTPFTVVLRK